MTDTKQEVVTPVATTETPAVEVKAEEKKAE